MKEKEAKEAEETLRSAGWDVKAEISVLGNREWELQGKAADGGKPVYGFSHNDMKILILGGQVARL